MEEMLDLVNEQGDPIGRAVPPCALEEQPPKTPAAIAAAMVRERTRVAFFIVSPSFFNVCSAFFSQGNTA